MKYNALDRFKKRLYMEEIEKGNILLEKLEYINKNFLFLDDYLTSTVTTIINFSRKPFKNMFPDWDKVKPKKFGATYIFKKELNCLDVLNQFLYTDFDICITDGVKDEIYWEGL